MTNKLSLEDSSVVLYPFKNNQQLQTLKYLEERTHVTYYKNIEIGIPITNNQYPFSLRYSLGTNDYVQLGYLSLTDTLIELYYPWYLVSIMPTILPILREQIIEWINIITNTSNKPHSS